MTSHSKERYIEIFNGKTLLEKHSLNDFGIWRIKGEDPNCDLGGYHHNPTLGYVEGTLEQVIEYAVKLPRFWQWGSGGVVEKIEIKRLGGNKT